MTITTNSIAATKKSLPVKSTKRVKAEKHTTTANFSYNGDSYSCTNKAEIKKWLECAKKHGECKGITYIPSESYLFGLFKTKALYRYEAKPGDTPGRLREMFNLKPGALRKYDEHIFDIDNPYIAGSRIPPKGQEKYIYFEEDDIMP